MKAKPFGCSDPALTAYDEQHVITYMRMQKVRIVLHIDPDREPDRARQAFESQLARAKWVARYGYRYLLHHGWSR